MNRSSLRIGTADADITPEMDIQLGGDIGRRRPVREIRERLHARVIVLEHGSRRCAWISLDLCSIRDDWDAAIRALAPKHGIASDGVLVHPLQNHSAPHMGGSFWCDEYQKRHMPEHLWWLIGDDPRYNEPTVAALDAAMGKAVANLTPVTIRAGRAMDGRVAFNRRFICRDATRVCHPHGAAAMRKILQNEGPIDPEVGVMLFVDERGDNRAALLHHTCHPVHGYPNEYVIADWPGAWVDAMQPVLGARCLPLVINGCCGNIHHANHLNPRHVNDHCRMGATLAESAGIAMEGLEDRAAVPLDWRFARVRLPIREVPSAELEAARAMAARPVPYRDETKMSVAWDWVYAHATIDLAERRAKQPYYDYPVQAFRFGDNALVALCGEPFVEAQLRIKAQSPAAFTFVSHMSNGYGGYIATDEALRAGGTFETRVSNWSRYGAQALDRIGDTALALLRELFPA